jgi:hypothetical protein
LRPVRVKGDMNLSVELVRPRGIEREIRTICVGKWELDLTDLPLLPDP